VVTKYGVIGLIIAAACGMSGVLSMFAYAYWSLASLIPASFNLPMTRVDAVYFTWARSRQLAPAASARKRQGPNCSSAVRSCSAGASLPCW
jgi:hypothetical protein